MKLAKKDIIVIILSFCIIISTGFNIFLSIQLGRYYNQETITDQETLIIGTPFEPTELDPVNSWERAVKNIIRQVAEPLWYYNLTNVNLEPINKLSESDQWINSTALSITLRQGIKFHDGTPFNADAVKWNIDRLLYLFNHTGQLSFYQRRADTYFLYEDPLGNPLISGFEVTGTYSGIIHLMQPYSSLKNLMCDTSSVMLSPTANAEDEYSFINLATGDLVGTGPFKYDGYIPYQEASFTRWDDYWGGPMPNEGLMANFKKLIFDFIDDPSKRNYAMLTHAVDWLEEPNTDLFDTFRVDPTIEFTELKNPSLVYSYLAFNNKQINVTWRKAISYAFNYTYFVENYYQGQVVRAFSPISSGFGSYYNPALDKLAPYCNYTIARQIIINEIGPINSLVASLPNTLPGSLADQRGDDDAWENATLVSFNFTYQCSAFGGCDPFDIMLYNLLGHWLKKIGINVTEFHPYVVNVGFVSGGFDKLQLFWRRWYRWNPIYTNPIVILQYLLSNISQSNSAQVNDPSVEAMITKYITDITLNETEKVEIIHNITKYLVTELYPHAYCFHDKIYTVHAANLYEISYNSLDEFYAYPIKRNLTYYSNNAI